MSEKKIKKYLNNNERLQGVIDSYKGFLLDVEEEKLKNRVYHDLMDQVYTPLEARAVAIEAVIGKRKMDSFGVPVIKKNG